MTTPILYLDLSNTSRFEASRFLDTPESIAAFLAEAMQANNAQTRMHAMAEVAKAKGVNPLAQDVGVNRERCTSPSRAVTRRASIPSRS